ncbi:invasion associated locus B family protein [Rhodopseudomonas sp. B29]|uniref:invasion associated locus B family protein n=1 Tax=Rhodopseudomonas sp. B29 TaxID=95607 RepID=UPI0003B3FCDE|nr:invasion associated locus B family protein [Rhodopseudomonas sp. B29]
MSVRRLLIAAMAAGLVSGVGAAQAREAKKPPAKPTAAKPAPAHAAAGGAEPSLIGQFGNWGAYVASPGGRKVCFALAKPTSSKTTPPNRPRDPAYAFISTRPAEKVVNEVSVMIGYPLKPGSDSTLEVGGASFAMYTQGDGIWIKNAAEEERLVEALRKAPEVTVKGVSAKGTASSDTFSLKGLSQALDKVAQACGG